LIRDHEAQQRKREHIAALQEERAMQEAKLQHAVDIGRKGKHRLEIGNGQGFYLVGRIGSELRKEAEASIPAIDLEIQADRTRRCPRPQGRRRRPAIST
jgi:hypothetical protein